MGPGCALPIAEALGSEGLLAAYLLGVLSSIFVGFCLVPAEGAPVSSRGLGPRCLRPEPQYAHGR